MPFIDVEAEPFPLMETFRTEAFKPRLPGVVGRAVLALLVNMPAKGLCAVGRARAGVTGVGLAKGVGRLTAFAARPHPLQLVNNKQSRKD